MRQMVGFTLKSAGYDVTEADNGQAGLDQAKTGQYDLVITDVNMPIMDGIEMTRQLRTIANYKFTPVLMLTTESAGDKKAEGKAVGATGWIVKPFNPEQLVNVVKKVTA
jgi:two-component system chemotaxis response regulator CheY